MSEGKVSRSVVKGKGGERVLGYIGLTLLACACAIGWLVYWAACATLIKYMEEKGVPTPTDEEIRKCSAYVWRKLLHIKNR